MKEEPSRLPTILVVVLAACVAVLSTLELLFTAHILWALGFAAAMLIVSVWIWRMPTRPPTSQPEGPWDQLKPWAITLGILHALIVGMHVVDTWHAGLPLLAFAWTLVGVAAGSLFIWACRGVARKQRLAGRRQVERVE